MALTILSYGAGQDSTAILLKYIYDPEFRNQYAPDKFLVVMAATGDEHPHTMQHIEFTKVLCREHGVEFIHITPDMGFHSEQWTSLRGFYQSHNAVGSKAFPKTCTVRLKLEPIYRFIEQWLGNRFEVETGRKKGFIEYAKKYGKIRMLIGISKGEEKRCAKDEAPEKWKRESIVTEYPLIDLGMDRQACQDYIVSTGHKVPYPSNCMLCPFANHIELLWLSRFFPQDLAAWIQIEANKIEANKHMGDRNLGVWGRKLLPQVLKEAEALYGSMTDAELNEHKFSHGHCVMSKY